MYNDTETEWPDDVMMHVGKVEFMPWKVNIESNDIVKVVQGRNKVIGVILGVEWYTTYTVSHSYQQILLRHCIDIYTHNA